MEIDCSGRCVADIGRAGIVRCACCAISACATKHFGMLSPGLTPYYNENILH